MSGRQPRIFAMNRYSVIQSEGPDEDKDKDKAGAGGEKTSNDARAEDYKAVGNALPDSSDSSGGDWCSGLTDCFQ